MEKEEDRQLEKRYSGKKSKVDLWRKRKRLSSSSESDSNSNAGLEIDRENKGYGGEQEVE